MKEKTKDNSVKIKNKIIISNNLNEDSYYKVITEEISEEKFECCNDPEMSAVAIRENPVILSVLPGGATYTLLDLVFTVWPDERLRVRGWFSIPSIIMGTAGFGIGIFRLYHPKQATASRMLFSFMENYATILPFTMGEVFYIVCLNKKNWSLNQGQYECNVTNDQFWFNFFTPMASAATLYFIWGSFSPTLKERLYAKHIVLKYLLKSFDVSHKILLFSRIFQALLQTVHPGISRRLIYEAIAIPGGVFGAILYTLKPHHQERIYTTVLYCMAPVLCYILGKVTLLELLGKDEANLEVPNWSSYWAILKMALFSFYILFGSIITFKKSSQFVVEQRKIQTLVEADIDKIKEAAREAAIKETEQKLGLLEVNLNEKPLLFSPASPKPQERTNSVSSLLEPPSSPSPKPKRTCWESCVIA